MSPSRRTFLAATAVGAVAGCAGVDSSRYQLVAGVERKLIRGTRAAVVRKIAETTATDSAVVDAAPTDVAMRTIAYDDAVVDLSGSGPLTLNATVRDRIEAEYESPYGVVVVTLYNDDPYNEIPTGNSYGYRVTLDQFERVNPGDRVSAMIDTDRDIAAFEQLLTIDSVSDQTG